MTRTTLALLAGLTLTGAAAAGPADGTWRFTLPPPIEPVTFLVRFATDADGKATGEVIGTSPEVQNKPTLEAVSAAGDALRFVLKIGPLEAGYDGRLPKEAGGKVNGSLGFRNQLLLMPVYPSRLKSLDDKAALGREVLATTDGPELLDAAVEVLGRAAADKVAEEDVRAVLDKVNKSTEVYGGRWARAAALRTARALAGQAGYEPLAVAQARKAERLLEPDAEPSAQLQTLEGLADVLRKAGKKDELAEVLGRLGKAEARDAEQYHKRSRGLVEEKYAGRKAASDRAVLVELFTGAECPPCVAADLAFDGLEAAYTPREVVLLQYHLHIPRPDPLTSPAAEERQKYYGDKVEGTPSILFNGKAVAGGGGPAQAAKAKLGEYRGVIDPVLETPAGAKLAVEAARKDDDLTLTVRVSDLAKPGEKVRLRVALAEETVRYSGGNGLRYHHMVVRAMPTGPEGVALTEKAKDFAKTVNLAEVRESLEKYLAGAAREYDVTFNNPPLGLRKLAVVAFVQDDETGEVLQAARAEVP